MNGTTIPDNYSDTYNEQEVSRRSVEEKKDIVFNKDQNEVLDNITGGGSGGEGGGCNCTLPVRLVEDDQSVSNNNAKSHGEVTDVTYRLTATWQEMKDAFDAGIITILFMHDTKANADLVYPIVLWADETLSPILYGASTAYEDFMFATDSPTGYPSITL